MTASPLLSSTELARLQALCRSHDGGEWRSDYERLYPPGCTARSIDVQFLGVESVRIASERAHHLASAANALPRLLAHIEALENERDELRGQRVDKARAWDAIDHRNGNHEAALSSLRSEVLEAIEPWVRHSKALDGERNFRIWTDRGYREVPVADLARFVEMKARLSRDVRSTDIDGGNHDG